MVTAILGLAACATTKDAGRALQSSWSGRNADDFFKTYGPPQTEFTLGDGGKIFEWTGGNASVALPATANTTATRIGSTTTYQTTVSGGGDLQLACKVQITTNAKREIVEIKPTGDSIGMWNISRCGEIFRSTG
jgi:hypothetical protein